jgi:subtilisin family serine protease
MPLPAHPGRIIVKYRPTIGSCVHCLLAQGVPFATVTGSDSLDRLHRRLGVRGARPLFIEQHGFGGDRPKAYLNTFIAAQERFPARRTRVPSDATAPDLSNIFVLELPADADVEAAAALYSADPNVEYAQPDYEKRISFSPNDRYFASTKHFWHQSYPNLWGLYVTQAPGAWDTTNGAGTVIAVVDSGIDYKHRDIAKNIWMNSGEIGKNGIDDDHNGYVDDIRGWDFVRNGNDPYDFYGHGTHVAGIAAAVGNNRIGVVGMAWGARVMAVRGINAAGYGYDSDLAQGIVYAAQNGADVINASWGGLSLYLMDSVGSASLVSDAVETARSLGVVVVAAAGNDDGSVDVFEPAGLPGVIAVGATQPVPTDTRADFSNYGDALSVAAPGVDILSLLSPRTPIRKLGHVLGGQYLRASGTSLAAPHVSGLAALLLSAEPSLTADEVRWHLELNADQPGYPGYEGQPWNPYLGWGRINAARVFDPPPVTTRVRGGADLHVIAGTAMTEAATVDLSFTTLQAVDWSLTAPSWLPPAVTSGTGSAQLSFSVDATGLDVGTYTGPAAIAAPTAADGGGSSYAHLSVHRDTRIGGIATVSNTSFHYCPGYSTDWRLPPPVAGDGVSQLVLRSDAGATPDILYSQPIDGAGNVSGPYVIDRATNYYFPHLYPALAFDGRNFLAVWANMQQLSPTLYQNSVMAIRVAPSGQPLDPEPIVLDSRTASGLVAPQLGVVFDGKGYVVFWNDFYELTPVETNPTLYTRRVGIDGTLRGSANRIYPSSAIPSPEWMYMPSMACAGESCLLVWWRRDGEVSPAGLYIDKAYGVRLVDGAVVGVPFRILDDISVGEFPQVGAGTDGYLVIGIRLVSCPGEPVCNRDVVVARVAPDGTVLDSPEIMLNNGTLPVHSFGKDHWPGRPAITFDGTNYIVTFIDGGSNPGTQVFAARLGPDGRVLDDEALGLLLLPRSFSQPRGCLAAPMLAAAITATPTQAILTWVDTVNYDPMTRNHDSPIFTQRVLAHVPPPEYTAVAIGSIGAQTVAERAALDLILTAPSLNPATTAFSGGNLPAGAVLDPTGILRWMPAANQAGVYPDVHLEATDGVQTLSEDIAITVTEANLSAGGTVTLVGTGTPLGGMVVTLSGLADGPRTVTTNAAGYFEFDDLVPGGYTVQLDAPSTQQYSAPPLSLTLWITDQDDLNLVVTPKL